MARAAAGSPETLRAPMRVPRRLLALRSDRRLVELVRRGDAGAFEVLYERHAGPVLSFCRHLLGSQHDAEDAVQQAFLSAHRDMLRGERELDFKPWLFTIARNRCLSTLRARREQPAELPEQSTAGLHEQVATRDDLRRLVADVGRLPEQQRAALVLSEVGDLSHAEIAQVLDCEVAAVKGLVFRARSALIERELARSADCDEIRQELTVATGGALRRSRLRYHLESCPGCSSYLAELRRQRKLLGVALPVVPTLALHDSVMAAVGLGAGGAGGAVAAGGAGAAGAGAAAGGAGAGGGSLVAGGAVAKIAVVVALAGGAGVAVTEVARDPGPPVDRAPAPAASPAAGSEAPAAAPDAARPGAGRAAEDRALRRGARRDRRRGPSAARGPGSRRGRALGRLGTPPGRALGRSGTPPGRRVGQTGAAPGPRAPEVRVVPPRARAVSPPGRPDEQPGSQGPAATAPAAPTDSPGGPPPDAGSDKVKAKDE